MANKPSDNNSPFQDIVLELQRANSILPKIEANTYESGLVLIQMSDQLVKGAVGGGRRSSSSSRRRRSSSSSSSSRRKRGSSSSSSSSGGSSALSKIEANTSKTAWSVMNLTDVISYNLGNLIDVLTGNKLQEKEDKMEFLAALKGVGGGGKEKIGPKEGKGKGGLGTLGLLGTVTALVAGIGALVTGFFAGIADSIKKILLSTKVGAKIGALIQSGIGKVMEFFGSITKAISESKILKVLKGNVGKAIQGITDFFKPVGEVFKLFSGGGKALGAFSSMGKIVDVIQKVSGPLFRLGKMFGKLFIPLNIIMSVYDTVMGGIEAYEKGGGIGSILQGGITGLISGLIGAPLDLLKSAVSWILGKMGFKEAESFLDSFDFSDLISGFIDRVIEWGQYIFKLIFQPVMDAFQDISNGIANGDFLGVLAGFAKSLFAAPLDILKNLLGGLAGLFSKALKKKIDSFRFGDVFGGVKSDIPKMPDRPSLWDEAKAKKAEKKAREDAKKITEEQEESLDLFGNFYKGLMEAYKEATDKLITGAEINATKNSTAEIEAVADSAPVVVANPPPQAPSISSSTQSVSYHATSIPDRTRLLLQPSFAGF